jgi:nicotinate-nucleotide adenylyltransferase
MRVGLFLGSFDPIHIGHISIVTTVLNANLVDKVIIIPAWHNPFKEHNPAPFMKRWEMCYQSTKGITNAKCAQVEGVLHDRLQVDKVPTYKVINVYKNDPFFNGSEIYIITTSETFSEIPSWENGDEIIKSNNFIVIKVEGRDIDWKLAKKVETYGNKCICDTHLKFIDISSTKIRNMIKENKIISPYVPEEAQLIIRKNNLYK